MEEIRELKQCLLHQEYDRAFAIVEDLEAILKILEKLFTRSILSLKLSIINQAISLFSRKDAKAQRKLFVTVNNTSH